MHYIIYKTTNNCNGKYYIGQHITDNLDDGYIGSGVAMLKAIKKYGKDNFTRVILCYGDSQEDLNELEELAVDMSVVNDPMSYNLMTGGGSCGKRGKETRKKMSEVKKGEKNPNKGRTHTPEARQKMSEANKGNTRMLGKTFSQETRQKMSEAKKNMSLETRKKISEANKGKTLSQETRQKLSDATKKYWQQKKTEKEKNIWAE